FVKILHVGVGWRAVQIEIIFFDVLAMIPFAVGQTEQPLFDNRIFPVPERQCKAKELLIVGDSSQTIFAPSIGARARLVVTKIVPRIAVGAIIFAHRAPLPLAQIRAPFSPRRPEFARFLKSLFFYRVLCGHDFLRLCWGSGYPPAASESSRRASTPTPPWI